MESGASALSGGGVDCLCGGAPSCPGLRIRTIRLPAVGVGGDEAEVLEDKAEVEIVVYSSEFSTAQSPPTPSRAPVTGEIRNPLELAQVLRILFRSGS